MIWLFLKEKIIQLSAFYINAHTYLFQHVYKMIKLWNDEFSYSLM